MLNGEMLIIQAIIAPHLKSAQNLRRKRFALKELYKMTVKLTYLSDFNAINKHFWQGITNSETVLFEMFLFVSPAFVETGSKLCPMQGPVPVPPFKAHTSLPKNPWGKLGSWYFRSGLEMTKGCTRA